MNIKKHIPNAITCGNLLCGCLAIIKIFEGDLTWAAYLVGIAAVLDFFDGFAARMLKVQSPIGKDLDSLADMVTFGVVPGMMLFQLVSISTMFFDVIDMPNDIGGKPNFEVTGFMSAFNGYWGYLKYTALFVPIFSALRLAKFNNDNRQTDSFIGLPTPANAIFICSLPLILEVSENYEIPEWFISNGEGMMAYFKPWTLAGNPLVLCLLTLVLSYLLVAEIPLFSLKFKNFGWAGNKMRFIFLGLSLVLLIGVQFAGIPLVIVLYILMSIVNNIFSKKEV